MDKEQPKQEVKDQKIDTVETATFDHILIKDETTGEELVNKRA